MAREQIRAVCSSAVWSLLAGFLASSRSAKTDGNLVILKRREPVLTFISLDMEL
jgi:hypothetical protein